MMYRYGFITYCLSFYGCCSQTNDNRSVFLCISLIPYGNSENAYKYIVFKYGFFWYTVRIRCRRKRYESDPIF